MTAPAPGPAVADSLSAADFAFLGALVHDRSGIVLHEDKQYLVHTRLAGLAARHGGIAPLCEFLRGHPTSPDLGAVVEAFTTNETTFFRDPSFFGALREAILPALVAAAASTRRLRIWSAACSTGQEAYSVLMLLRRDFPLTRDWDVRIVGTDLSAQAIARAAAGTYSRFEVSRGLTEGDLERFFVRAGNDWQIEPRLRAQVELRQMNLAQPWPRLPVFDLVLLRNVLIYFDATTKEGVLRRAAAQLVPGGTLALGSTESAAGAEDLWSPVRLGTARVFRRAAEVPPVPTPVPRLCEVRSA